MNVFGGFAMIDSGGHQVYMDWVPTKHLAWSWPTARKSKTLPAILHTSELYHYHVGLSENSVPLNPMVLLIIIPIKWLFHWEY